MGKSVKFYFSTISQLIWLWHELLQCISALRHEHLEVLQFVLHWHLLNPWPPQILWARTISRKVNSLSGTCISLSPLYLMDSIWFLAIFPLILPLLVPTIYPYSSVESITPITFGESDLLLSTKGTGSQGKYSRAYISGSNKWNFTKPCQCGVL